MKKLLLTLILFWICGCRTNSPVKDDPLIGIPQSSVTLPALKIIDEPKKEEPKYLPKYLPPSIVLGTPVIEVPDPVVPTKPAELPPLFELPPLPPVKISERF